MILRRLALSYGTLLRSFSRDVTPPSRDITPGILVLNAGSSSLKFNLFSVEGGELSNVLSGVASGLTVTGDVAPTIKIKHKDGATRVLETPPTHAASLDVIAQVVRETEQEIVAVGHRVVHGGELFTDACVLDAGNLPTLAALNSLAPLHNPHNVAGVEAAAAQFSSAVQVGVFDTAYHSTLPDHAYTYALPGALRARYRRYGFHGTSHKYVVERAAAHLGKEKINAVSLHLGNGCSVACIRDNLSVDTSMGYTPLAGLPMGTRSGDIDPSIVLKLLEDYTVQEVHDILHNQSGLYGIAGSSDNATVERGAAAGDPGCSLAFRTFAYQARKHLGAYTAVLENEVDCVIFTGGIGENSPAVHEMVCGGGDVCHDNFSRSRDVCDVSRDPGTGIRVLVVKTNEELAIARECLRFC